MPLVGFAASLFLPLRSQPPAVVGGSFLPAATPPILRCPPLAVSLLPPFPVGVLSSGPLLSCGRLWAVRAASPPLRRRCCCSRCHRPARPLIGGRLGRHRCPAGAGGGGCSFCSPLLPLLASVLISLSCFNVLEKLSGRRNLIFICDAPDSVKSVYGVDTSERVNIYT